MQANTAPTQVSPKALAAELLDLWHHLMRGSSQHLYALIGPDGAPVAYIDVPPALDADPLVGHQVGVRGKPRPRVDLSARLIEVQDLESLDD